MIKRDLFIGMKRIRVLLSVLICSLFFINCVKAQPVKTINPEISAVGIEAIKINNTLDDIPYSEYTVALNEIYVAKLLNEPKIEKGDGIEIPLDAFGLPEGIKIFSVKFSMPGYSDIFEFIDIQLPPPNPWRITETEARDRFGDLTGEIYKGISYRGEGTFRNSTTQNEKMTISIGTQIPGRIGITAFEYGEKLVELGDGSFSYKIGDEIIGGYFGEDIRGPSLDNRSGMRDETKSFLYLLKQGGIIRVQVYKNKTTYSFTVDANGFKEAYSKALDGSGWGNTTYYYVVPDKNNRKVEVKFTIEYTWSYDKEELYKNNPELEEFIRNFFRTKDLKQTIDGRGYYRSEFVKNDWGKPILQHIKTLFSNENIEYKSTDDFFVTETY